MRTLEEPRRGVRGLLEAALGGILVAWRCAAPTPHPVYLDIPFYLGLFWIFLAFCPKPRAREAAALGVMLLLLGIYLWGAVPHMFSVSEPPLP